ncbi:MAG: dephospho-CoA kinase [Spirosomataceae bacterium]
MLKIGVTGGIGSGKSIVCEIFKVCGIPVYNADDRAKWLTNNDLQLRKEIKELLGRSAYDADGQYNRKWVAEQVFANPDLLKQLNMLIHPRVFDDTDKWITKHKDKPYVIKEAALMNKAGVGNDLDKVILVTAPLNLRIARIQKRDPQRSLQEIEAIINRQKSEEEFLQIADFTVINDDSQLLIPQIIQLHQLFSKPS